MKLDIEDYEYLGMFLEGFLFGTISVLQLSSCWNSSTISLSGLYSGIFALYLQYHSSQRDADTKRKKIVFYALWMLYVLSATIIILDNTSLLFLEVRMTTLSNFVLISVVHWQSFSRINTVQWQRGFTIARGTASGCCRFIAQFTLVRITW